MCGRNWWTDKVASYFPAGATPRDALLRFCFRFISREKMQGQMFTVSVRREPTNVIAYAKVVEDVGLAPTTAGCKPTVLLGIPIPLK